MADNEGDADEACALRPLQAAPGQSPGPSPGTSSPPDSYCPGSAYRIAFGPRAGQKGYAVKGSVWLGVMVTAGTPRPIIEHLNRELEALLREPEIKPQMEARLVYPDPMGLEQFTQCFANETRLWTRPAVENGIKADG